MSQQPGVIEVLDAPAAAGSAESVLARLAEREDQRAALAAKRLQELEVTADPRESVDAFLEDFTARKQQLEAALQQAAGSSSGDSSGNVAALAAVAEQIAELEKAVADSAYFLPAYDLRQATLALTALREQQEAAAAALQPRKKFSFNRKAAAKPPPAAAAAEQPAAGSQAQVPPAAAPATDAPQQASQGQQQQQVAAGATDGNSAAAAASASGSTISGLRGQVIAPSRAAAAGQEFTLTDLEDCTVFLLAPLAALFLHRLHRCKVYTGPVAGACFVEGAQDSVLMIAAQQVRIHAAHATDFYLRVRSHPIIEHSSGLRFAPYGPAYDGCQADLEQQGLEQDSGMWRQVNDFGWLRATPSPHWAELPENERQAAPLAAAAGGGGGSGGGGDASS